MNGVGSSFTSYFFYQPTLSVDLHTDCLAYSSCTRELALRHSQNTSTHWMDCLLGARMDGSVALVTSLGRARLGLG